MTRSALVFVPVAFLGCDNKVNPGSDEPTEEARLDDSGAEDCAPAGPWYTDSDSDGYGAGEPASTACIQPVGTATNDDDCDDSRSDINPHGIEVCDKDDADEDCNGLSGIEDPQVDPSSTVTLYRDADADGYGSAELFEARCEADSGWAPNATDCDDTEPEAHPGMTEICGDGIDNDCDGVGCRLGNIELSSADFKVTDSGELGTALAADDFDGDGISDLAAGMPGNNSVVIYAGGTDPLATTAATVAGTVKTARAGHAVDSAGDTNGDGYADLIAGQPEYSDNHAGAGSAVLYAGPLSGTLEGTQAEAVFISRHDYEGAGQTVAGVGDIDGNGFDDLLVGTDVRDLGYTTGTAIAHLVLGPVSGSIFLDEGALPVIGDSAPAAGAAVASVGDTDGDGVPDLWIGAAQEGPTQGMAVLVNGPRLAPVLVADEPNRVGGVIGTNLGWSVGGAGDVNGDGNNDVLVADGLIYSTAYLLLGPVSGASAVVDAEATFMEWVPNETVGAAFAALGDLDGDGSGDFAIGAIQSFAGPGGTYVFYGPVSGATNVSAADAILAGEAIGDRAGAALAGADLDGDGLGDLAIGAPLHAAGLGAVYVTLGVGP